jgi:hypothetical protein
MLYIGSGLFENKGVQRSKSPYLFKDVAAKGEPVTRACRTWTHTIPTGKYRGLQGEVIFCEVWDK